jgi:hypothetical protein
MAGLVPAIHVFLLRRNFKDVDARDKPGRDESGAAFRRTQSYDVPTSRPGPWMTGTVPRALTHLRSGALQVSNKLISLKVPRRLLRESF